jgi:thiamine biosynthesis lipoprotein
MRQHIFQAMGTTIELLLDADDPAGHFDEAVAEFERLEALLSRFRPDSELSRLNRDGFVEAGPQLTAVTELALAARERTGGRFDPTVHDALVEAGYDRSFEFLSQDGPGGRGAACGGAVSVDGNRIEVEPGFRLDLGGIAKGYTADRAADILAQAGACLVNAGGDIAVRDGSWPVGVEDFTLLLEQGGLATSGRDRRRWLRGGEEQHHLIDPSTGEPARTDLLRVTVVGRTAVEAEVQAKALFLAGRQKAAREADLLGLPCVLVTDAGETVLAGGLS